MRIFISWSGDRSKRIAEKLHVWMPQIIQALKPYISSNDIEKGARWASDIATHLDGTDFGVVCLVPSNLDAPWIQFEAGALAKSLKKGKVAPILFGVDENLLAENPLVQFQFTHFVESDLLKLMKTINKSAGKEMTPVSDEILERAFRLNWPELETAISEIINQPAAHQDPARSIQQKALDEITALGREQMKRLIALEERVALLLPGSVQGEDGVVMISFLDGLIEYASLAGATLGRVESTIRALDISEQHGEELRSLQNAILAANRLLGAATKARSGGGLARSLRSALPELRTSIAALNSW